ncbi:MAG TPA: PEP-CTERM sorting domain-containing protein [Burkholderiaceae bacterium]|nr:PEP-CTERM sorting domain-containing protein [Burkholderiaceae bacterium]HMY99889.1 PEP-CTERM sorting domain-containing protein [Burkholderiaceae bacterium]HNB45491.1 PEP-CTERM sorting domain-containing protein [Burkholderiaceae bacterium]
MSSAVATPKWNLIIDLDRCNNCNNCVLAVKDEHVGNDFPGYAAPQPPHGHHWLEMKRSEHGQAPIVDIVNVPTLCNHCDDAPCVKAGRGAVKKRDDGIVLIDPQAARGRRDLVDACPYGAVWWNEELQLPQHWIFDAHLLDQGWKAPRCAQACPTEAIRAVKVSDGEMAALAAEQGLEVLKPELGTRPRVHYRNLKRFTHWVLAGSVVTLRDGVEECVDVGSHVIIGRFVAGRCIGQIVGFADFNGLGHAYLLTPVPEPETQASLLAGLGVIGSVLRRRRQPTR